MTEKDKAAQRSMLIFQLGKLLAPLFELAEKTPAPTAAEYQIASARGLPDADDRWSAEVNQFATIGDVWFGHIARDIMREPHNLLYGMPEMARGIADDTSRQADFRDRKSVVSGKSVF